MVVRRETRLSSSGTCRTVFMTPGPMRTRVASLERRSDRYLRARRALRVGSELAPGGHVASGDEIAAQVEQFLAEMHDRESADSE